MEFGEEESQALMDADRVERDVVVAMRSESPTSSQLKPVSKKRSRATAEVDENMELDTIPEEEAEAQHGIRGRSSSQQPSSSAQITSRKKRAIEGGHSVKPTKQTSIVRVPLEMPSDSGEAAVSSGYREKGPGPLLKKTTSRVVRSISPDRDEDFMRAIADLKMGNSKRNEKETDKDFKAIRAVARNGEVDPEGGSKETGVDGNEGRDWVLLDDIKLDYGIRGNFMRVVEFEVLGKGEIVESAASQTNGCDSRDMLEDSHSNRHDEVGYVNGEARWAGRSNFKAFKKVCGMPVFVCLFIVRTVHQKRQVVTASNKEVPVRSERRRGKENKVVARSGKVNLVLHKEPDYGDGPGACFLSLSKTCCGVINSTSLLAKELAICAVAVSAP
jgi:hypothetical protein